VTPTFAALPVAPPPRSSPRAARSGTDRRFARLRGRARGHTLGTHPYWGRGGAAFLFGFFALVVGAARVAANDALAENPDGVVSTEALPESPGHGAQHTTRDGTLVVHDKVLGFWRLPQHASTYWVGGRFLRAEGGVWLVAAAKDGPWELLAAHSVPEVLRKRHRLPYRKEKARLPWGVGLTFDPARRVYAVDGHDGVFLTNARFYRAGGGGLLLGAPRETGPWQPASFKGLPKAVRLGLAEPVPGASVRLPDGTEVSWDAVVRAFAVAGREHTWLFDGDFYERRGSQWHLSPTLEGEFEKVAPPNVPAALRIGVHRKELGRPAPPPAAGRQKKAAPSAPKPPAAP
jgi:hypothetical protein